MQNGNRIVGFILFFGFTIGFSSCRENPEKAVPSILKSIEENDIKSLTIWIEPFEVFKNYFAVVIRKEGNSVAIFYSDSKAERTADEFIELTEKGQLNRFLYYKFFKFIDHYEVVNVEKDNDKAIVTYQLLIERYQKTLNLSAKLKLINGKWQITNLTDLYEYIEIVRNEEANYFTKNNINMWEE